jgi:hypothetical protein
MNVAFGSYAPPVDWWVFVPPTYMYSPVFYRYYDGPAVNVTYINRTSIVSNYYVNDGTTYIAGPSATDYQRATNQRVAMYDVREGIKPSQSGISGNTVNVYRPEISRTSGGERVAPRSFTKAERPIGKMEAISSNDGRPLRMSQPDGDRAVSPKQKQPVRDKGLAPAERQSAPVRKAPARNESAPSRNERTVPVDQRVKEKPVERKADPAPARREPAQIERNNRPEPKPSREAPTQRPREERKNQPAPNEMGKPVQPGQQQRQPAPQQRQPAPQQRQPVQTLPQQHPGQNHPHEVKPRGGGDSEMMQAQPQQKNHMQQGRKSH